MPPVGFEPIVSAGERPNTYALDRAATGTGATAIDTILKQKGKRVKCIYFAIGQKVSTLFSKSELKLANFF